MNADDEKKLHDLLRVARPLGATNAGETAIMKALIGAFALGRRAGMTEAARICRKTYPEMDGVQIVQLSMHCSPEECAASIEKARDA